VVPLVVAIWPPGVAVTLYAVMSEPLPTEADQLTVAEVSPGVADTLLGGSGKVAGVTGPEDAGGPSSRPLVAVTAKV
jgi:hypothetical protein